MEMVFVRLGRWGNLLLKRWDDEWPYIRVVLKQLAIPAAIAVFYGLYDWYSSSERPFTLSGFIKVVTPALFFVMWLYGMCERIRKKTSDKNSFDTLNNNIQSLTDLGMFASTAPGGIRQMADLRRDSILQARVQRRSIGSDAGLLAANRVVHHNPPI